MGLSVVVLVPAAWECAMDLTTVRKDRAAVLLLAASTVDPIGNPFSYDPFAYKLSTGPELPTSFVHDVFCIPVFYLNHPGMATTGMAADTSAAVEAYT